MKWERLPDWLERHELAVFLLPLGWLILVGLAGTG